jgi:hypothetical protein
MPRMPRNCGRILLAACVTWMPAVVFASPPVLGVLHQFQPEGEEAWTEVVAAFQKDSKGWSRFREPKNDTWSDPPPPSRATWTVCFDGRALGQLESETVDTTYNRTSKFAQRLVAGQHAPVVGPPTRDFSGWAGGQAPRPLVITTTGKCQDPEGWHRAAAPPAVKLAVLSGFRKVVGGLDRGGKGLTDAQVQLIKAHTSTQGRWLVTAGIPAEDRDSGVCGGAVEPPACLTHLFLVGASGPARHLGDSLTVIDAGDYDGDGQAEVVAMFQRYNHDGYTVFFQGLAKQASYGWGYH